VHEATLEQKTQRAALHPSIAEQSKNMLPGEGCRDMQSEHVGVPMKGRCGAGGVEGGGGSLGSGEGGGRVGSGSSAGLGGAG
jgi:hypothetical protein